MKADYKRRTIWKRLWFLAGIVLVLCSMFVLCDTLLEGDTYSVLQIEKGNLTGSGVIRILGKDSVMVVTAAHVLDAEGSIRLVLPDGEHCQEPEPGVWSCYQSTHIDVAFIIIPVKMIGKEIVSKFQKVDIDKETFDKLSRGDEVQVIGAGQTSVLGTITEPWIYLEDYGQHMMLLQGEGQPGMSGAGVFDMQGNFIGIISGMDEQGQLAAVPFSVILAEESVLARLPEE